ncbi:hypothetical protein PSAC2689_80330 [Paraburkholderia sacchari]
MLARFNAVIWAPDIGLIGGSRSSSFFIYQAEAMPIVRSRAGVHVASQPPPGLLAQQHLAADSLPDVQQ